MTFKAKIFVLGLLVLPFRVWSCVFHLPTTEGPKGATWNVIQSQIALKQGLIEPIGTLGNEAGHRRAMWWLTLLQKEINQNIHSQFYIYIADISLWSLHMSNTGTVQFGVEAPENDNYLILTSAVLHNVITNTISIKEGIDMGVITAPNDSAFRLLTNKS